MKNKGYDNCVAAEFYCLRNIPENYSDALVRLAALAYPYSDGWDAFEAAADRPCSYSLVEIQAVIADVAVVVAVAEAVSVYREVVALALDVAAVVVAGQVERMDVVEIVVGIVLVVAVVAAAAIAIDSASVA